MSLRKLVTVYTLLGILCLSIILGSLLITHSKETEAVELYVAAEELDDATHMILQALTDAETGQRGYLLTRDESFLEPYWAANEVIVSLLNSVEPWIERAEYVTLNDLINRRNEYFEAGFALLQNSTDIEVGHAQAIKLVQSGQGKEHMDEMRSLLAAIQEQAESRAEVARFDAQQVETITLNLHILTGFVLFGLLAFPALRLRKMVVEPLEQIHTGIQQLANFPQPPRDGLNAGVPEVAKVASALRDATVLLAAYEADNQKFVALLQKKNEELVQLNSDLERKAYFDPLTELLNKTGLFASFNKHYQEHATVAVLLIDIDYFKSINDMYCYEAGDKYLVGVAHLLADMVGSGNLTARLGATDFAVLLPSAAESEIESLAESVRASVESFQLDYDGISINRTVSIGVAITDQANQLSSGLRDANNAVIEAKSCGRNQVVYSTDALADRGTTVVTSQNIAAGLNAGEFVYYLQPIIDSESETIAGFEALIRWQTHGERVRTPNEFLSYFVQEFFKPEYAERRRLMHDAVAQELESFTGAYIAWNFNLEQFASDGFVDSLIDGTEPPFINSHNPVVLEINEKALNPRTDMSALKRNLQRLRDAGYKIALDDFGTEQSNFTRMMTLPLDIVKLDKSLVDEIEGNTSARAVVRFLGLLAKHLSLKVIVEGVETSLQMRLLRSFQANLHQGYFHSKPLPVADILEQGDNLLDPLRIADSKIPKKFRIN